MSQQSQENAAKIANQQGATPDTPKPKASKPFRKRRCKDCGENFISQSDVKLCQNCGDAPDKSEQEATEFTNKKRAKSAVKTETKQVTPYPQEPAKQKQE